MKTSERKKAEQLLLSINLNLQPDEQLHFNAMLRVPEKELNHIPDTTVSRNCSTNQIPSFCLKDDLEDQQYFLNHIKDLLCQWRCIKQNASTLSSYYNAASNERSFAMMLFSDRQKIQQLEGHLDRLQQWAIQQDIKNEKENQIIRQLEELIEDRRHYLNESCHLITQAKSKASSSQTSQENYQLLTCAEGIMNRIQQLQQRIDREDSDMLMTNRQESRPHHSRNDRRTSDETHPHFHAMITSQGPELISDSDLDEPQYQETNSTQSANSNSLMEQLEATRQHLYGLKESIPDYKSYLPPQTTLINLTRT